MSDPVLDEMPSKKKHRRGRKPDENEESDAITKEGEMPKKAFYRARAHVNPLSHNNAFKYPVSPDECDWRTLYPKWGEEGATPEPSILDVGCGFGGLTVALAKLYPEECSLGMEIRAKVCEFVRLRIEALRVQEPGQYRNAAVLRTNSMRYLPNYFKRGQLSKLFFCFPDPHFKVKNHRRRIVSDTLLSEYAYALQPTSGRLYLITDVEELHGWHVRKCDAHPAFRRVYPRATLEEEEGQGEFDPAVAAMIEETEEGKKVGVAEKAHPKGLLQNTPRPVARAGNAKYWAVYERVSDEEAAAAKLPLFP